MTHISNASIPNSQIKMKILLGPPSYVLNQMQTACFNGDGQLQTKMTCIALGQFSVVNNTDASVMMQHVFSYVRGSKSVAGLESLFLSGLAHLHRRHEFGFYEYGVRLWLEYSKKLPHRKVSTHFIYLDREFNMVTFLPGTAISNLVQKLEEPLSKILRLNADVHKTVLSGGLGDVIRFPTGYADTPWDNGYSKCVAELTSMGTIGGGLIGGLALSESGPGAALGIKGGAAIGAALLGTIGVWSCDDPKPVKEDRPEKPVKELEPQKPVEGPDMGAEQPGTPPPTSEPTTSPADLQSTPPEDKQSTPDKQFVELECYGYPNPDSPDQDNGNPRVNPLATFAEPLFYPNPETGLPGGPAGMPLNFLMHNLPRLGFGSQAIEQGGFLI